MKIKLIVTDADQGVYLEDRSETVKREMGGEDDIQVVIDPQRTYQTIDGFGASFTDSSAYNISILPEEKREALLTELFDPEKGIGLSVLRQPTAITDYNLEYYTYDDMPDGKEDFSLSAFSIDRDRKYLIPLIKKAQSLNPNMRFYAATWTPPLWMKEKKAWNSLEQNKLRRDCYDVYCDYLIRFLKAYEAEGIVFQSISPQNELAAVHKIPACFYECAEMGELIKNHLKPKLIQAGLHTEIWCWDFNWWHNTTMETVEKTYGAIDGVAFHFYGDDYTIMDEVHEKFPDLPFYLTEAQGRRQTDSEQIFRQIQNMSVCFRRNIKSWVLFNILLDQDDGPWDPHFKCFGTGIYRFDNRTMEVEKWGDFYALAHASKYIKPGAVVIDSTDTGEQSKMSYLNIAFRNQDGSIAVILGNQTDEDKQFSILIAKESYVVLIPAKSVATMIIEEESGC